MADVFGKHAPKIPYQPIADLLAQYARRDAEKLAIVDLDQESSISFGALERAVTDVAAALKQRGVRKGSRVLLLADETVRWSLRSISSSMQSSSRNSRPPSTRRSR